MNAVVVREDAAPQSEGLALIAVIERAAANPAVDVEKMRGLMELRERAMARIAEAEFSGALANLQLDLPSIGERGGIKDRNGNVQSTYALWEDINETIKPILHRHGFALSFRTDCADGIAVTGVLSHKNGHREATTIKLPADTTGSKNAVQAVASSVSYGKRYTAGALLNLTSHGEDDDGSAAAKKPKREATGKPQDGMRIEDMDEQRQIVIREHADAILALADGGKLDDAARLCRDAKLAHEEKVALWDLLPSHHRTPLKRLLQR